MSISDNLRQLRLDRGLTQEQAAVKLGVTRQAISSYESGRTRPDIDMLMRLSEVYGTDLDGILYGQSRAIKTAHRIKVTAVLLLVLLLVLTFISSGLLWCANYFYLPEEGQLTQQEYALYTQRQKLTGAWEVMDTWTLWVSSGGYGLLFIVMLAGRCSLPLKQKLLYAGVLMAGLLGIAAGFALADPAYGIMNYIVTPLWVVTRMLLLLAAESLIRFILHGKKV